MLGYITRAKMHDKAFSSLGGYYVVPDEENKKLIITEAIGEGEKKLFICHCCTDLTSLNNAKNIDSEEMKLTACNHSKLSQIMFGDLEVQKVPDKKKNVIDIVKDGKETIAIVFPSFPSFNFIIIYKSRRHPTIYVVYIIPTNHIITITIHHPPSDTIWQNYS